MMSGAQTDKNNAPVNNMGIGIQSGAQRAATGNKAIKAGSREAKALAKARGKKKKGKGKGRGNVPSLPDVVPVQIPIEPDEEELGLE
jgi:hypothetical protein